MASIDDEIEQTHLMIPKVFVFQVPKLVSSDGYKASDWPKAAVWNGQLRVVSKGKTLSVLLEHTDKDGLFAACPVTNDKTVEPTIDSSRYFVLRISDGKGKHALLGLGFNDRTQAFDFKVAIQDYENSKKSETGPKDVTPLKDLSIPAGGKIHVNLKGGSSKSKEEASSGGLAAAVSGLKLGGSDKDKDKEKKKKKKKDKDKEKEKENSSSSSGSKKEDPDDWVAF